MPKTKARDFSWLERLDLCAELTVSHGNSTAEIRASSEHVSVNFVSINDALSFWRRLSRGSRAGLLNFLRTLTEETNANVSIDIDNETVATLSSSERGGLFERVVGVWPLNVRPRVFRHHVLPSWLTFWRN